MPNTIRRTHNVQLQESQIARSNWYNDVWMSPPFEELITLQPNDTFVLDVVFTHNRKLELIDDNISETESIKITVDGEGGVGGAPNNQADYDYYFTGVEGDLVTGTQDDPITGTQNINPINGNYGVDRDIELVSGGPVTIEDIHIELTNRAPNNWSFDKVSVGVDADNINIK